MPTDPLPLPLVLPPGAFTASVQKAVEQALAQTLPEGKRGALVAVLDPSGAKLGIAAKLGDDWKLAGEVMSSWDGDVTGQLLVMGSW